MTENTQMNYRTQVLDAARVFWQQHTQADALSMTMAELHDDVELVIRAAPSSAAPQPAAQAGEYPDLPDLYSTGAPFWRAVLAWHDAHHGLEAINTADKLEMLVADMLRAYVDADRAARGATQAAPVDAAVKPAINVGTIGHAGSGRTTLTAALGKLIAAQKVKHD